MPIQPIERDVAIGTVGKNLDCNVLLEATIKIKGHIDQWALE